MYIAIAALIVVGSDPLCCVLICNDPVKAEVNLSHTSPVTPSINGRGTDPVALIHDGTGTEPTVDGVEHSVL